MGRHSHRGDEPAKTVTPTPPTPPAAPTASGRRRRALIGLVMVALVAMTATIAFVWGRTSHDGGSGDRAGGPAPAPAPALEPCAQQTRIAVAEDAAPLWQPVLDAFARDTDRACQSLGLAALPATAADAALVLAEASAWLAEDVISVTQLPAGLAPISTDVVAHSPLVLVTGGSIGEPAQLQDPATPLTVTAAKPTSSAASALGLDGLIQAIAGQRMQVPASLTDLTPGDQRMMAAMASIHLVDGVAPTLAQPLDPAAVVLTSEAQAWRAAGANEDGRSVLYLQDGAIQLQMPLVAPRASADIDALRAYLGGPQGAEALGGSGMRSTAGHAALASRGAFTPRVSLPAPRIIDAAEALQAVGFFSAITTPVSSLSAIDISGSMSDPMPGAPAGLTKIDLIRGVARAMFQVAPPGGSSGMITFHSDPANRAVIDYAAELARDDVPGHQERMLAALDQASAGGTPLYNTVVFAYKAALEGYTPGIENQLIVLTDGDNRDTADSITLNQMSQQVQALIDPQRPISVTIVAFGQDADVQAVTAIAQAVDGTAVAVPDFGSYGPALGDVFLPRR